MPKKKAMLVNNAYKLEAIESRQHSHVVQYDLLLNAKVKKDSIKIQVYIMDTISASLENPIKSLTKYL